MAMSRWQCAFVSAVAASCGGGSSHHLNDASSTSSPGIYVTQGGSVLVFDITANGDAAPVRTIAGANTGLGFDHRNNIFVADRTQSVVAIFATNANGNVAPVSTLTAPNMLSPEGLA